MPSSDPSPQEQINVLEVLGFTSCATSLKEYACLGTFPPCVMVNTQSAAGTCRLVVYVGSSHLTGVVATPALPCFNSCKGTEVLCSAAFKQLGLTFPGCPPEQIVFDLSTQGGGNITANCTAFSQGPAQVSCPLSVVMWGERCAPHLCRKQRHSPRRRCGNDADFADRIRLYRANAMHPRPHAHDRKPQDVEVAWCARASPQKRL